MNNRSITDSILMYMVIMSITYIVVLAIPIIPYFDIVINIIFSFYKPDSFFGNLITVFILYMIGHIMLKFIIWIGERLFFDKLAMYLFLYGQGLVLISNANLKENGFIISKAFISIISLGFNEKFDIGKNYIFIFGLSILFIGIIIEYIKKPHQIILSPWKKDIPIINNKASKYNKLQILINAEKLLNEKRNLTVIEQAIVDKSIEYRQLFSNDELQDIQVTINKYKK